MEQDRKLEAVRDLLHKVRQENRWVVLSHFTLFYSILLNPTLLYTTLFYSGHLPDLCCQLLVFEFLICYHLYHLLYFLFLPPITYIHSPFSSFLHTFFSLFSLLLLFRNNFEKTTVKRDTLSEAVLDYFQNMNLDKMRASLKIIFVGEPGVDEGGLLTEMFSIFFESVFSGEGDLFVGSGDAVDAGKSALGGTSEGSMIVRSDVVLPSATDTSPQRMLRLRAFGRAMVKALYEGRRMGNRLCPSVFKFLTGTTPSMRDLQMFDPQTARSLQWTLATAGVEEFGIHFESVGEPEKGHVTDSNKAAFVRAKIDWILVKSRQPHLLAIKAGQYLFCLFIFHLYLSDNYSFISLFPFISFLAC